MPWINSSIAPSFVVVITILVLVINIVVHDVVIAIVVPDYFIDRDQIADFPAFLP
jgi:hypothetical protein